MIKLIKIILTLSLIILISGCSLKNISKSTGPKIDLSLEQVDNTSIKTISDINSIAFEWNKVDDVRVSGYNFYRSKVSDKNKKIKHIKLLKNRYSSHYVDTNLESNTNYIYAVSSATENGFESKITKSFRVNTLDIPIAIPFIHAISNLPKQIKVIWRPHPNLSIKYYNLFRNQHDTEKWKKIATVQGRLQAEYIDTNLENNIEYNYKLIAYTFNNIASKSSNIVQAKTKSLPKGIHNLSISQNLPKKIHLQWKPSFEKVITSHKIYRSSSRNGSYSLIRTLSKNALSYTDPISQDGSYKFYKVTIIGKEGLESSKYINGKMGMSLSIPKKPILILAQIQGGQAILNWKAGDNRAKKYVVYKVTKENMFTSKKTKFTNISLLRFVDTDIIRGVEYKYSIQSIDKFGISSKHTKETTLVFPELVNN